MSSLREIIAREDANTGRIYLYGLGGFFRAYQQSAFMFVRDYAPFRPIKRYVNSLGREVVSIGFPKGSLLKYFEPATIVKESDDIIYCECTTPADVEEFGKWVDSIEIKPATPATTATTATHVGAGFVRAGLKPAPTTDVAPTDMPSADADVQSVPKPPVPQIFSSDELTNNILRRLRDFRINDSSPMECMIFLGSLQQEIDKNFNHDGYIR